MFLLGGLFVAVVVGLMLAVQNVAFAMFIGVIGLGIVWYQWYNSDTLALKAMRARVVAPARGAGAARDDRPAVRAGRHAEAARRDRLHRPAQRLRHRPLADRAAVCVTTGILDRLTLEELEGVLAHELSHVAHRDVLVMTLASSAGIITGMVLRGAQYGGLGMFGRDRDSNGLPVWLLILVASIVVYAVSFLATRAALALPRAVAPTAPARS